MIQLEGNVRDLVKLRTAYESSVSALETMRFWGWGQTEIDRQVARIDEIKGLLEAAEVEYGAGNYPTAKRLD